jgi:hypothetical protein
MTDVRRCPRIASREPVPVCPASHNAILASFSRNLGQNPGLLGPCARATTEHPWVKLDTKKSPGAVKLQVE